jgi:D-alanine--poly(phosphoribitol) ligase subunit 2
MYSNIYQNITAQMREEEKMNELLEILNEIDDTIDYNEEKHLIDDHLLDSFSIISLVGELEKTFDISIEAAEMTAENFNSAESLWAMVQGLQEEA